jgi:hypothetical protein
MTVNELIDALKRYESHGDLYKVFLKDLDDNIKNIEVLCDEGSNILVLE